jgi:RNA polymerase sigma-70 factor (ECF subfamily)
MNTQALEFQKVYEDFQPKILRYLARLVGKSEAEDLAQETFVKVHQSLKNFRGESQLSTWMYRIATNTALDKLRSPSFQRVGETSMLGDLDETDMADKVVWGEEKKPMIEKQLVKE